MAETTMTFEGVTALKKTRHMHWLLEIWVRIFREKPLGAIGAIIVVLMLLMAIFADLISPYDPIQNELGERLKPYSSAHWLGTDGLGRDFLSRIIHGARISMYVGLGAVGMGILFSTTLGVLCGYFGGKLDIILQRVVDAWMAFPALIILLTLMAVLGAGLFQVILVLGLSQTFASSRVIRSAVLAIKENQYVEAARTLGCRNSRIILFHILPNIMAPIIVLATVSLGTVILAESSLSFLGFGVPPPQPSWGGMLSGPGRTYMFGAPWLAVFPGIAISLAVFAFNMLGDALRDVLDPRLRGSR